MSTNLRSTESKTNSHPGVIYILETLAALHIEHRVSNFTTDDTQGNRLSWTQIHVTGFREFTFSVHPLKNKYNMQTSIWSYLSCVEKGHLNLSRDRDVKQDKNIKTELNSVILRQVS